MSPRSDTRERMIASTAALIREHGASATSLDDILAHSGAPRGSIYHHFPDGRAQIIEAAVDAAGGAIGPLLQGSDDPVAAFDSFLSAWKANLETSEFRAGCPVLAVAIEADPANPQLTDAAAAAFGTWTGTLAAVLKGRGVSPARARSLATLVVASVEGAVVLCRVQRSTRPLDDVGRELRSVLQRATES